MQVIPYAEPLRKPIHTNDTTVVFACGVVLVVAGAMIGFIGMSSSLVQIAKANSKGVNLARPATSLILWTIIAGGMIVSGIGSMRLRRWARVLVLCACANSLAIAIFTLLVMAVMYMTAPPLMPVLHQAGGARLRASRPPVLDDSSIMVLQVAMIAVALAVMIILLLIYRSRRVTLALEEADRTRGWIDGRPMPAIALAMALAGFALTLLITLFNLPPIPIGYVSGDAAEARVFLGGAMIVLAVFFAWAAWLIFRLHPLGTWLALLLVGLTAGGCVAALGNEALRGSFGGAGMNYAPYEIMWYMQISAVRGAFVVAVYAIPAALYVLHVRRILHDMSTSRRQPRD